MPLLLGKTATVANEPAIQSFLQTPTPVMRTAAVNLLKQFTPPDDPGGIQVELWGSDRTLRMALPESTAPLVSNLDPEFAQCAVEPFRSLGQFRAVNNLPAYPAAAAVKDDQGKAIGFLVRWRRVSPTANVRKQLAELLGSEAAVYYGNSQGAVWTDLEKIVPMPPANLGASQEVNYYTRDGNSVMARGRPIAGTPWAVVVEFPDHAFLIQAHRFLRRSLLLGLGLLVVGVVGAVVLSHNIIEPLRALTEAASAISAGDYSRTVETGRHDELGKLASVFNAMVASVGDSRVDLERSEHQYRLLFESNPLPMWVFDRETLQFLAVNEAAIHHYGFSREEFLEMTIKDIRPSEEIPRLMQALSQPIKGYQLSGNWQHRRKDDTIIDVEIAAHSIDFEGRPAELVLANDVTDRIHTEETLRVKNLELATMTQQLWQTSKLATMGELAASIAHELNNPLATSALRLESLAAQLSGNEQMSCAVEIVAQEVERMGRLVGGLLEFSRRGHQQISTLNISEELARAVDLIEYHLRSRKIELVYEFDNNLSTIHADRQQLRQVFLNLLTNAADAMPNSGKLIIRAATDHAEGGIAGVRIEFADSGSGIHPKDLERIWEPFFTTKPEGKGTGLGLAICRRMVEEHRGTISIDSVLGSGTTVSIFLPSANRSGEKSRNEAELELIAN